MMFLRLVLYLGILGLGKLFQGLGLLLGIFLRIREGGIVGYLGEIGWMRGEDEGVAWRSRDQGGKSDVGGEFAQGARAVEGSLSFDCLLSDEAEWGAWTMLEPPYSLTKRNDTIKALYNSSWAP